MLLTYFLNDFEIVPVAPIITCITLLLLLLLLLLLTAIWLSPGGSGYFTCIQNMKSVILKVKRVKSVHALQRQREDVAVQLYSLLNSALDGCAS